MDASWSKKRKAMKTKNILKTLILSIAILTATSCKKDEKENPQPQTVPQPTFIVEYKAEVSGNSAFSKITYKNKYGNYATDIILAGETFSYYEIFTGHQRVLIDSDAEGNLQSLITTKVEIWIDGKKRASDSKTGTGFAYTTAEIEI